MRNNMRNIARFLFRILFFSTAYEKKEDCRGRAPASDIPDAF